MDSVCQPGSQQQVSIISTHSFTKLLKFHREVLVGCIKNTECVLNNLIKHEYISNEEAELSQQHPTQAAKVRKILDLVESKGEETAEYFLHILYQASEVYTNLSPWLKEIQYQPSEHILTKPVIITDAISQYIQKIKHDLRQDTKFVTSYVQKEDILLDDTYTETLMELINAVNETKGSISHLDDLFNDTGVINEDAETVFVTGDAGVGKTILLKRLQNLWSKGELCADVKFFFKFRCRIFNSFKEEDKISLRDLLFKYNCYPDKDADEIFSYIRQHPASVLFTLDGFDEINVDCDLNDIPDISSPFDPTHPVALLMNLLRGKLLKCSKKILTARTGTNLPLRMVRKRVTLKGFSKDHLLQYLKRFFKNKPLQTSVLTQLEANPHLCSLCSVPLFCWIIFKCYEHFQSESSSQQLLEYVTLTDIYLLMLEVFLNRSSKTGLNKRNNSQSETFKAKKDALMRLGKLAKEGIENSNFIFSQEQITAADISEEDLQLGFVKNTGHYDGCGSQSTYEFLHLTLQSFFAAFSLVVDEKISAMEIIRFFATCDSYLTGARANVLLLRCLGYNTHHRKDPFETNEHLQFTTLFLCGLLSKAKRDLFKHLASTGSVQRKRSALKAYLADCVKSHLKNLPQAPFEEFSKVQALPRFVWLMRYIFETQSEAVAKLAAKGICADYIKLTFCNAFSADCSAIANILRHRKKSIALELDNNNINDYGVKELIPCFDKLTVVRLSVNQVTDDGAKVLAEELTKYKIIKILGLYRNQITDVGARFIARIVEECPYLRTLKIGLNKLTSEGGKLLAQAIQKNKAIKDIGMWGNRIGDVGAVAFAEAIRNHPSIKELSLAANGISTEGGKSLAAALRDNRSLEIFWLTENQLNDEAAELFAEALRVNKSLLHLWVISNKITVVGANHFFEILKENATIEEICLNGNSISAEEAKRFKKEKRIVL
ncbi:nucleotide-binding oligomerization domain-containing protein 1 [Carcharodon carcharias]|uniref:nucleotide-binding oligomerization domain-containing protein 1 n=1 Tax=Carcharodon carcharias TaxID=13397 RepID=UPI001B7DB517|nr:nucleotide-binding oligomerization domain-containing protein 1 [Carcharodon carcharias]XP_041040843.1 nucleotide-binding oligomerization domain-containing protein 1 [Carcharodon carcharias]XP_041040844.1 nucleotide-binding oligomerization domain-containing protein 1 [Carcharodon carcharias]XP_041040845.1 nucleotide-binding oligomerization domain-containing protein 1 [Carcharodon carcharias]